MCIFYRETICCGTIFKGPYGEVMIDPTLIKPCIGCVANQQRQRQVNQVSSSPSHSSASASPAHSSASASPAHSVDSAAESTVPKPVSKSFSDSSSDSGYDESSNQGIGKSKLAKIIKNSMPLTKQDVVKTITTIKSVQLKAIPVSEAIRLNGDMPIKLLPVKQVEQILYKPISLASSTIVTTKNTNTHEMMNVPGNPLVDFAIHASARQSITN